MAPESMILYPRHFLYPSFQHLHLRLVLGVATRIDAADGHNGAADAQRKGE